MEEKNEIELLDTTYLHTANKTIDTYYVLQRKLSRKSKYTKCQKQIIYVYNDEGTCFYICLTLSKLLDFLKGNDTPDDIFEEEKDLDNFLENLVLEE